MSLKSQNSLIFLWENLRFFFKNIALQSEETLFFQFKIAKAIYLSLQSSNSIKNDFYFIQSQFLYKLSQFSYYILLIYYSFICQNVINFSIYCLYFQMVFLLLIDLI
ncbi:hypothetical protein PPERSA_05596 [Pseudocohnilembus persalinus]|uniref:Transmembrane protein n=1 Tax=Pseudocohnilembus persalinus TaxID=266149 RepID=A0A0V0Q7P5_PSEPJ|nr:hypothetical protein PPERSA_05596 [Pseudocohnilembus persalinus]|eukprot:KRW98252.1 hypothetical protein PPERSA_05596 [Pseudocohnilembus persalinus]